MSDIRLISFDLDDTLWPGMPTILAAEQALYDWLQQHVPAIPAVYSIEQLRDQRRRLLQQQPELAHDLSRLRLRSFELLAQEFALAQDWIQPAFEVFYRARQQVRLFDDVSPVLDRLQSRYRLASLSNGNADVQLTGVAHWFELSLNSITAGSMKSEPHIYQQLQQQLAIAPEQHVHVGDDPVQDVQGARAAGACAIWLNRDHRPWPQASLPPHAEIHDLHALEAVLPTLGGR